MKNYLLKTVIFSLFFVIYTLPLMAQEDDPHTPPIEGDPIDGWMLPLAFAGILVAVYFILKRKQKSVA